MFSPEAAAIECKERGNVLFKKGEYKKAIQAYLEGSKYFRLPELYFNMGLSFERIGETGLAIKSYQSALKSRPDYEKAKRALTRLDPSSVLVSSAIMSATASSEVASSATAFETDDEWVRILDFKRPETLFYHGEELPIAEVEAKLSRRFCNSLSVAKKDFKDFQHYCHTQLAVTALAARTDCPPPVSADHFDIRDMGEKLGHALFVRKAIPAGIVLTYYCGYIRRSSTENTSYALVVGNPRDEELEFCADLPPDIFTFGGLMQHLPFIKEEGCTVCPEKGITVAKENISRSSVSLIEAKEPMQFLVVTPLVAARDLKPGEIVGFSYTWSYWQAKSMVEAERAGSKASATAILPRFFTPEGRVLSPSECSIRQNKIKTVIERMGDFEADWPINVQVRSMGSTFAELIEQRKWLEKAKGRHLSNREAKEAAINRVKTLLREDVEKLNSGIELGAVLKDPAMTLLRSSRPEPISESTSSSAVTAFFGDASAANSGGGCDPSDAAAP